MTGCFYRRLPSGGEYQAFDSTDYTRSNWNREIQHGSPPLALLTKLIEELSAGSGKRIARLSLDLLGAVPVAPVRARAWVQRRGSRISMVVAELVTERPVARVTAWLVAVSDTADAASDRYPPLVEGPAAPLPAAFADAHGYFDALDSRPQYSDGHSDAVWWFRPQAHVVDDEPASALQRLAAVVDCANGVGAILDFDKFVFMNTDTVVHLHRLPVGNDFALRARASVGPDGAGVTTAELFDTTGFVGTSAQTLLIQRL
ncbi:thioesterase [Mycobacterium kubicae]|uniref:Thioesterase n=1 Tax=Mycobacterium kubicae TaxID=120959 RepID=A0AAX1J6H6_9MYCO|nr:thioesterase family protein [Mycobacterium kubicae]MCV7093956.1 thioesterase family protein [Mycobacterium kubicae]OBK46474.1 thioesterase [Mycobacterium kubicae]ORV95377.1 thioesterase [Mycobacterium kubicae]QNI12417.1 thioesterase family protein [Mycobacterium kubicae]QPI35939.1 thioesterase family protein [Mycobacterium kubicae]